MGEEVDGDSVEEAKQAGTKQPQNEGEKTQPPTTTAPNLTPESLVDTRITVVGVKARPELNGMSGVVRSYNSGKGRLNVELETMDGDQQAKKFVALKPKNLAAHADQSGIKPVVSAGVTQQDVPSDRGFALDLGRLKAVAAEMGLNQDMLK